MEIPANGTTVSSDHVLRGEVPTSVPPVDPVPTADEVDDVEASGTDPEETIGALSTLDSIFPADVPGSVEDPNQITLFTPVTGEGALYIGGALLKTGDVSTLLVEALVRAGARVVSSDDFLLGNPEGGPAESLDDVATYTGYLDQAEALRKQAQALLDEAAEVESRIAEMSAV